LIYFFDMLGLPQTIRQARLDASLSQVELAARAGTSQSALARYETGAALPTLPTLERLLAACGRRLEIQTPPARHPSPGSSMRGQLGPQADKLRRQRRRLLDAAEKHGIGHLRAFGSLARGEATAESDVDLLVDLKPGRTLLDLAAFRREASEILDLPVDVATTDMLKGRIRDEVLSEALPL
jgi:predicted nucleotidyltransferase/DNA-binding XRE family transcriptional regulator